VNSGWTIPVPEWFNQRNLQQSQGVVSMGINMTVSEGGGKVTIAVTGKFDFQLYDEFRASYANTAGNGVAYVVDLSATDYLDSSALGMLLLLREHAGGETSNIEIRQPSADVRKILAVANFGKLFKF
jgi:anti-anti-sigma factor